MNYTGDVQAADAWKVLQEDKTAILVDVRTQPEWAFTGICDLSPIGKSPLLLSWQEYPHMMVNPAFVETIQEQNISKETPMYFLCRSGVRSQSSAAALYGAGYKYCYNIIGGFEGDKDEQGHRGVTAGWKASGLPWTQG